MTTARGMGTMFPYIATKRAYTSGQCITAGVEGYLQTASDGRLRAIPGRTLNESTPMKIGQYIHISLYGKPERVLVLAIHRAGTIDVQRSDGACYRVSGL